MIDQSLFWTELDREIADREGWMLTGNPQEIQKIDCEEKFSNDEAAQRHVASKAGAGSTVHQKALDIVAGVLKPIDAEVLFDSMQRSKRYRSLVNAGRRLVGRVRIFV